MRLYQKKINSLGIDRTKLSKGLKTQVDDIINAEQELNDLASELEQMDQNDEDYEEKQGEVQELREAIDEADMELVASIDEWWAKREVMVERGKHMQQAKKAKQAAAAGQPAPTPTPTPQPQPQPQPQPPQQPQPQPAPVVEEKKKRGGSWVLWAGLALVGGLIGVNLMRNRD